MKKNLKNLVKGGIETIILIVVLVAIVIGLFIAVILPMVNSTENMGTDVTNQIEQQQVKWMNGEF